MRIHVLGKVTLDIDGMGDKEYCPSSHIGEVRQVDLDIDDKYAIENNLVEKFKEIPFAVKIITMPKEEKTKETKDVKNVKGDKK